MKLPPALSRSLHRLVRSTGIDYLRFDPAVHPLARRRRLMSAAGIDLVLDVGANAGQYGRQLRDELGYAGRIVSFEPLRPAHASLQRTCRGDPAWTALDYALSDGDGESILNVAGNSFSSSLLEMLPAHEAAAPESRYVDRQPVRLVRLDAVFDELRAGAAAVMLKLDVQGFEARVLRGAERSLAQLRLVQLEMSLRPLYRDELLLPDMCQLMAGYGFRPVALEPGFADPDSSELLQVDGVFAR